ncbi:MAG: hypothetical protein QM767_19665 [Anaeromyxobacter sp.]
MSAGPNALAALQRAWAGEWEPALAAWSRFTKLSGPRWCLTGADEARERLSGSFAQIRLTDHAVVIGLRPVREAGLERFARQILAHEIGHHVFVPGDLADQARLLARLRRALPTREPFAGYVANLYADLLVNDRLQRAAGLDMAAVYRALRRPGADRLWTLYLRIYERLWALPRGELVAPIDDPRLELDADLGARVIRTYARDWLRGAGRFGTLLLPYLLEADPAAGQAWLDTAGAGAGAAVPDGLALDEAEDGELLHPAEDPALSGVDEAPPAGAPEAPRGQGVEQLGGQKHRYREPSDYVDLMASLGVKATAREVVMRYYRERAVPHLLPFPSRLARQVVDPQPEGFDAWELGSPVPQIDWVGTLTRNPVVLPGLNVLERAMGTADGGEPRRLPLDLYVGIDCSGSMGNPAVRLSYPVLAGAIVALSALRAGAQVMACLSGEPGRHVETPGFVRDEREVLTLLTDYLGTGYAFGVERLRQTFLRGPPPARPTHLLVVSDGDLFHMLGEVRDGWQVAAEAARVAGGGATAVLQLQPERWRDDLDRLEAAGWTVHPVDSEEELVAFARAFARARYAGPEERG